MTSAFALPPAIPFCFPGLPNVRCLFSTRAAGDMRADGPPEAPGSGKENRRRFMRLAGFDRWAELRQVHGDSIVPAAPAADPGDVVLPTADGQYTLERGTGLIIKTADCQPLLFARADGNAVAALHMGWRGNARNLPALAVSALCRAFACEAADLLAVRGPSLGPAAAEFVNFATEWPPEFSAWHNAATRTVDLWSLTRRQLREAGLRRDRIFSLDLCTRDMRYCFFSHRRGDAGRQIGAIWLACGRK